MKPRIDLAEKVFLVAAALIICGCITSAAPVDRQAETLYADLQTGMRPYVAIGRASTPPVIDGRGGEEAWEHGIVLEPFFVGSTSDIASAPTAARLIWDDENIYVHFRCEEPILEERRNRLEDFRRDIIQDDASIWHDQCVAILLSRPGGEYVYDFFINANAAVADARGEMPSPWESRDSSFDGQVAAEASVSEGLWEVELSIPWSSIGGHPGDEPWRLCLGRIRHAISETSAWRAPTDRGLHEVSSFGYARFVQRPIALSVSPPQDLQPGRNTVQFQAPEDMPPFLVSARLNSRDDDKTASFNDYWEGGGQKQLNFSTGFQGRVELTINVWESEINELVYRSPAMTRLVAESRGIMSIRTGEGWEVALDAETIADGSGDADDVAIPFHRGINVLTITLESGTGAFAGDFQGIQLHSNGSWVMAEGTPPEKIGSGKFDTSSLPRAALIGDSALEGASRVGSHNGPMTLRKTILWRYTRVNPKPSPAYYIAPGIAQSMNIPEPGLPGRKLEDYALHVAVPEGVDFLGPSSFYGGFIEDIPQYEYDSAGTIDISGKRYNHWLIAADSPVTHRTNSLVVSEIDLYLRADDTAKPGDSPSMYLWSEAEEGAVQETPQQVRTRVVEGIDGRQPQQVRILMWTSYLRRLDNRDLMKRMLDTFQTAGVNWISYPDHPGISARRSLHTMEHMRFWSWNVLQEYASEHPEAALIRPDGTHSDELLSPAFILGEGWPIFEAELRSRLLHLRPDALMWDAETNPFAGYMASYDEASLQQFAEFADIEPDGLTPETVNSEHADKWIAFTCDRVARLCLRAKRTLHEVLPEATMWLYSGYQSERTRSRYSVDWARLAELKAIDVASAGYGRKVEAVEATQDALGDIPLVTGVNLAAYRRTEDKAVRPLTKATLLRRLTDGRGGILIFNHPQMEGRSYHALGEITRLVADHEDIFTGGRLDKNWLGLGEHKVADTAVVKSPSGYLLAVMNESDETRSYTLTLPNRVFESGHEYYSGRAVHPAETITLALPPHDAAAYILK